MYPGSGPVQVSHFPSHGDLVYSAPLRAPTDGSAAEESDDDDLNAPSTKPAEHPSRTLFVRNLANDTDPVALQAEFEQFGPIRSVYANCKYRGYVMISFFDIRHSKAAMLVLNGKKVRGKRMDIHFALPKDNPGEKDANQGTLVVFNLDPALSEEDIRKVFSVHGEVKDIRTTPNKNTHKFIEFFDVRDAERALMALNRTKVGSKMIKIEVSRPSNRGKQQHRQSVESLLALDPAQGPANPMALFGQQNSAYGHQPPLRSGVPSFSGARTSPPSDQQQHQSMRQHGFVNSYQQPGDTSGGLNAVPTFGGGSVYSLHPAAGNGFLG